MTKRVPRLPSETLPICILLTLVGGFLDAYTYLCRGEVFANAITGDLVMMAIELAHTQWLHALTYFCMVVLFALGVIAVKILEHRLDRIPALHWRQIILLAEICLMVPIIFLPHAPVWDLVISGMITFLCGMQVQAFRRVWGVMAATTMCTGNLRSGADALQTYFQTKDKTALKSALKYFGIIGCFAVGVAGGTLLIHPLGDWAMCFPPAVLLLVFFLLFREKRS